MIEAKDVKTDIFSDEFIKEMYSLDYKTRNEIFVRKFSNLDVLDIPYHGIPQIGKSDFQNPKGWVNSDNQPPYKDGWSKEDYLKLVEDFEDPYELIVKNHEGVEVVRDDLLPGNLGSKARYAEVLMQEVPYKYLSYAMVAQGQALKVLASVCKKHNKMIIGIAPWRKEPTPAHIEAMKLGAILLYYRTGGMAGARKRCRAFIHDQLQGNAMYVPAGVKHEIITAGFMKSVMRLIDQYKPDTIFCACSTGVMAHAISLAAPNADIHAVQVAGNSSTKKWPGRLIVHEHSQPFNEPVDPYKEPPFESIPEYDAKVWQYAKNYKEENPDKKVMMWNVAGSHPIEE